MHVAVLGTGTWAEVHLQALTESPHVDRVMLVGRNRLAREALAGRYPIVQSTAETSQAVCEDDRIQLVHVVVPHHLHACEALSALEAGKHVICEKPAGFNLDAWDLMAHTADQQSRQFLVVLNQLYHPLYRRLREVVADGLVGHPFLSVENAYSNASTNYRRAQYWRTTYGESGGGILIDGGFHMVYRHLDTLAGQGSPSWVQADTPQLAAGDNGEPEPAKGEDCVQVTVGYEGRLRIHWSHAWTLAADVRRHRQSFLAGTKGTLELTDRAQAPLVLRTPAGCRPLPLAGPPLTGSESTRLCLLDYLESIATGSPAQVTSRPLARQALAVVLGAYESSRAERRVRLE